jgi:hypothetical protein
LPLEWAFHRDGARDGKEKGYASATVDLSYWTSQRRMYDLDSLKDYPGDEWEMLRTDIYAQAQGVRHADGQSFTGQLWYRTSIELTEDQAGAAPHLMFPGVFGPCRLYINGDEVAQREQQPLWWLNDYRFQWDVNLSGKLRPGQNEIALACECEAHFGGIFRRPFLYSEVAPPHQPAGDTGAPD